MRNEEMQRLARRRATLLKLAAAGALGVGGMMGFMQRALAAGSLPATPGFHHIKGSVMVDNTRASIGMNVKPGQTVTTGPDGEAVFILGPDAFMLRPDTRVGFDDSTGVATLRVHAGRILSVFGKGKRQLETSTATIAVRGTGCYIEAEAARTYFCLCYGDAELTPKADPAKKELLRSERHDRPLYIGNQPGATLVSAARVINHTDAELTMLENSVGRWPPFHGKKYWLAPADGVGAAVRVGLKADLPAATAGRLIRPAPAARPGALPRGW